MRIAMRLVGGDEDVVASLFLKRRPDGAPPLSWNSDVPYLLLFI